ncbi:hypothetical protein [Nitrosomonas marina]|uniref:hypothetical protein n=1 Tax=Nitrosomonas marina TaxID=917 RepID=UPI000B837E3E|nr:hypothetical protein [Nitrosomonas marina]
MQSLIDGRLAETTMLPFVLRGHKALSNGDDQAIAKLRHNPVMDVVETQVKGRSENYHHCSHGLRGAHLL